MLIAVTLVSFTTILALLVAPSHARSNGKDLMNPGAKAQSRQSQNHGTAFKLDLGRHSADVVHMPARDAAGSPVPHPKEPLWRANGQPATAVATVPAFRTERHDTDLVKSDLGAQMLWPATGLPAASPPLWSVQDPASCDGYFANGYNIKDEVLGMSMAPKPYAVQAYIRSAGSIAGHVGPAGGDGAGGMFAKGAAQLQAMSLRGRHRDALHSAAAHDASQRSKGAPPLECRHNPRHPSSYCVMRHVALRPDLVRMSQGNESLDTVQGRPDAEELPVYQLGAFQVLVNAGGDQANPSLQAPPSESSTPLTESQQHALSKVCTARRDQIWTAPCQVSSALLCVHV